MNIVICGSFSPSTIPNIKRMRDFLIAVIHTHLDVLEEMGLQEPFPFADVYPTDKHLEDSKPCIMIHHEKIGDETDQSLSIRNDLMKLYFQAIDNANLIFFYNLKDGHEYIGAGALMELGYAHAKNKKIYFLLKPTEANVMSMFAGNPKYLLELFEKTSLKDAFGV